MRPPLVSIEACTSKNRMTRHSRRGFSVQHGMNPVSITIGSEFLQLAYKVYLTPEENVIQIFASNRSDQPLDKRMRYWYIWNALDLFYLQNAQICLPSMELEQRIVV